MAGADREHDGSSALSLDSIPVGAFLIVDGSVVATNRAALDTFGVDGPDGVLAVLHESDRGPLLEAAADVATAGGAAAPVRVDVRSAAGPPRCFFTITLGPAPDGGAIAVVEDTSERHRLDAAIAEVSTGLYTTDGELRGGWMPERLAHGLGLTPELFDGIDVYGLVHPDDVPNARSLVERAKAMPGVSYRASVRIVHPTQTDAYYPVLVRATWLVEDDALGGLLVRFDSGQVDDHLDADVAHEAGTLTLRDATPLGYLNQRADGFVIQRNPRIREILRTVTDVIDGSGWIDLVRAADRPAVDRALADALGGSLPPPLEVGLEGRGRTVWVRLELVPYRGPSAEVAGTFVSMLDVTTEHEARDALNEAKEQLWSQARHDALTGLANRTPFAERLTELLAGDAPDVTRAAVLVCDLDGFKAVNDSAGHRVGDELLIEIARRLQAVVRSDDLVCRYGGDEFLVVCEGVAPSDVEALAERIVTATAQPVVLDGVAHQVGVSVGVAFGQPGDVDDPDALVRRADRAMYRAKSAGGHQVATA